MFRNFGRLSAVLSQQFHPNVCNENYIAKRWAGHSKWANIRHTKEEKDRQKCNAFGKLSSQIVLSVREGGDDPKSNYKLKTLLEEAKRVSMPSSTIQNAIKVAKGTPAQKTYWVLFTGPSELLVGFEVSSAKLHTAVTRIAQHAKRCDLKHEKKIQDFCTEKGIIICEPLKDVENAYEKAVEDGIEVGVNEVFEEERDDGNVIIFECLPTALDSVHKKLLEKGYIVLSNSNQLDYCKYINLPKDKVEELNVIFKKIEIGYHELVQITTNIGQS